MLEKIKNNHKLDKKSYNEEIKDLQERLKALQLEQIKLDIPLIIALEGWSSSGKGSLISKIVYSLDPRYFNVYTFGKISEEHKLRPMLASYWQKTPTKGHITIFDKSWHRAILKEGIEKWNLKEKEIEGFYHDVHAFEEQLIQDGTVIVKLFLNIDKDEQKRRFEELEKNKVTKWRIDQEDWKQNKNYDSQVKAFEKMIFNSNFKDSPWYIIEANDSYYATVKVYKILINVLEKAIAEKREEKREPVPQYKEKKIDSISILSTLNMDKVIENHVYKKRLEELQNRISELCFALYKERRSVIIVYEGWDASGKGGNIKRLTQKLDPRSYEVISTPAPTKEELAHHYLWRFWNRIPKDGHIAIYDRSWYGRVLVEKIEGFCTVDEGERAYTEINDMELNIHNHGTIIYKFFLHITEDEQLARFKERQADPLKQYKITDEDWRNRDKWGEYEVANDEMLFRTNTTYAPWTLIEGNNKKYARIKVLEHIVNDLEKKLE